MKLNLVVALNCEAKPIIKALNLKKDLTQHVFEVYRNQDKTICLIISGTGKINAAAATSYIALYNPSKPQAFLNIGSAGGNFTIGNVVVVDKLQQPYSKKSYYPKINFLTHTLTHALETVDVPSSDYAADRIVDMEAYGFYQTAIKFTTQEFIQVVKIISDYSATSFNAISETYLSELMHRNLEIILDIIKNMSALILEEMSCS